MSFHIELSNASVWQQVSRQTGCTGPGPTATTQAHTPQLPAIPPTGKAWAQFTATPTNSKPYTEHLSQSIQGIRQFIQQHAAAGAQKNAALNSLRDFEATKVNCRPTSLTPLMVNENRRNLHLISSHLGNETISLPKRIGAVLSLAEGLNVCIEGTTLNILSCASDLVEQQHGLAGLVIQTKNDLIDQHLLQLVRQQDSRHLGTKQAKDLEIHHVQALKNHVATDWGLSVTEDRYATREYQDQAGEMAKALLEKTVTPAALAAAVADKIASHLTSLTTHCLSTGMPTEQLKTEPLRQMIQAEFGHAIELEQCLQFNDDYSEVKLRPHSELTQHVMQAFQHIGLIASNLPIAHLANQPPCTVEQALEQIQHLQGRVTEFQANQQLPWNLGFWYGSNQLPDKKRQQEEERRKPGVHQ